MRSSNPASPEVQLCYCPEAVRALQWAADELVKARTELQRRDPYVQALDELRKARVELQRARDQLDRISRSPALDARAALLLERIEAAIPKADYLTILVDKLDAAEVIAWRR